MEPKPLKFLAGGTLPQEKIDNAALRLSQTVRRVTGEGGDHDPTPVERDHLQEVMEACGLVADHDSRVPVGGMSLNLGNAPSD